MEATHTMNGSYFQSVIKDRERDVSKYVEINQIHRHYRDSARSQLGFTGKGKIVMRSWFWAVARRLKGVLAIKNKDGVKV